MPASVMTMPEAKRAVEMHAEGFSQPQIAAALNRSRKAVRTAFRQLGVQQRSRAEGLRERIKQAGGHRPWQFGHSSPKRVRATYN